MTIVILLILAIAWTAALLPPWLKHRREQHVAESIMSFRAQLSTLERATPVGRNALHLARPNPRPAALTRSGARRRRRDILFMLAGATVLTFAMAVALQGVAVVVFLGAVTLLAVYTSLLVQIRQRTAERESKVRYLRPSPTRPEPALLLRRSASN